VPANNGFAKIIASLKANPIIVILLFLFAFGVFLSTLIPPFQSPDEQDHLKRAYLLSQGRVVMESQEGGNTGGQIDVGLNDYINHFNHLRFNIEKKLSDEVELQAGKIQWANVEVFSEAPGVNNYFPLIYTPQALALWSGRMLGLTINTSYYLARYFALISALVIFGVAFNLVQPNAFVVGILIVPLMIFQMVSTSQDGVAIALVVLSISIFIKITTVKSEYTIMLFLGMCACIFVVATARINVLPMLIMPFSAAFIAKRKALEYFLSLLVVLLVLLWIIYALKTTVDNRVELGASTINIIYFYVNHPADFIVVLANTLSDSNRIAFYAGSFVGVLGWLDTKIGSEYIFIILASLVVLLIISISLQSIKKEWRVRLILLIVSIATVLLTFFLLLISWTAHPAHVISGIQGRYFWAPAILLGYALCVTISQLTPARQQLAVCALLFIVLITALVMPNILVERYWTD
jgi:uncharacterized membrane protein